MRSVFPDGAGGIVFLHNSNIFHQADPETDPETLVLCPGSCLRELLGVAMLGESSEVIYTYRDHYETPEGSNPHYEDVLHRISLKTRETVRLIPIGGYEWGTSNISVTDASLFGYRSTEASQGWIVIDLQSGETAARCNPEYQETGRDCPQVVTGFADDLAVVDYGFTDVSEAGQFSRTIRVLALRNREVDINTHSIPIRMPPEVDCILNLRIWDHVAVINTSTHGPCWHYDYTQPYRSLGRFLNRRGRTLFSSWLRASSASNLGRLRGLGRSPDRVPLTNLEYTRPQVVTSLDPSGGCRSARTG